MQAARFIISKLTLFARAARLIYRNLWITFWFCAVYRIVSIFLFQPLCSFLFRQIMRVTGYTYLTQENMAAFFFHPLTLLGIAALIILMTFFTVINFNALIYIMDCSYHKKRADFKSVIAFIFKHTGRIINRNNFLMPVITLLLMPFMNIGFNSGFISSISMPEFIMSAIQKNPFFMLLFIAGICLLWYLLLKWMFSFHYFTLENCNYKEARARSKALSKTHKWSDLISLLILQAASYLIVFFLNLLTLLVSKVLTVTLDQPAVINMFLYVVLLAILLVILLIALGLAPPLFYAVISVIYYDRKKEAGEPVVPVYTGESRPRRYKTRIISSIIVLATALFLGGSSFYIPGLRNGRYAINIEDMGAIEVSAHRGDSLHCPENTISAFQSAIDLGADWLEIDVQQTADRQLVISHDANLKRTTGKRALISNLTYDEIRELDAGSYFSPKYSFERIPLLESVILLAIDHNIRLNIELKPTGAEVDFAQSVIDLIHKYDFQDRCVLTSQKYYVLEEIREIDPELTTVYVMTVAYGNLEKMEAADAFSIEESFITEALVSRVHNAGKSIYAWTVNSRANAEKMIRLNVDNIVTDNIALVRRCIDEHENINPVTALINLATG